MRISRSFIIGLTIILMLILYSPVTAQDGGQDEPYYIVQEGESLWEIAARFGISVEELQQANNIGDVGQVVIGARLVIPGLSGVSGKLDTITVPYGETLSSLSRRYGVSESALARLNRLVSPSELYASETLIVPIKEVQNTSVAERASLTSGQSLLELAVQHNEDVWSLASMNNLPGTWSGLPMDVLQIPGTSQESKLSALPEVITKVEVDPLQMVQGGTTVIKVYAPPGITMRGLLDDQGDCI